MDNVILTWCFTLRLVLKCKAHLGMLCLRIQKPPSLCLSHPRSLPPPISPSPSPSHPKTHARSSFSLSMAVPYSYHTDSHLRSSNSHREYTNQLRHTKQRRHEQRQCHTPHGRAPTTATTPTRSQRQPHLRRGCR